MSQVDTEAISLLKEFFVATVNDMKHEIQQMISKSNLEINERLTKLEYLLMAHSSPNSTPSINMVNNAISNTSKFKHPKSPTVGRRRERRSRSISRTPIEEETTFCTDDVQSISIKELKRKDSFSQTPHAATLHFLFKYKKIAVLTFPIDATIQMVKEQLNQHLLANSAFCIEKLKFSTKRLETSLDDDLILDDDSVTLKELGFTGNQLLYCFGVNKLERKRARTLNSSHTSSHLPTPRKAKNFFPSSVDVFAPGRKKKGRSSGLVPSVVIIPSSPDFSRRNSHVKGLQASTTSNSIQTASHDEFSQLQELMGSDTLFDNFTVTEPPEQSNRGG